LPVATSTSFLPSNSLSAIIALLTRNPHALSAFLLEKGFIVRPVVPPTVPPGAERVRICLRAEIERDVVERLAEALAEWVEMKVREHGDLNGSGSASGQVAMKAKL
jgi:8-amino-7-oxononanoate synthase